MVSKNSAAAKHRQSDAPATKIPRRRAETRRAVVRRATGGRGMELPNAWLPSRVHGVTWDITVEEMGDNVQVVLDLLKALIQVVESAFDKGVRPFQHSALLANEYAPQLTGLATFHAQMAGGFTGKKSYAHLTPGLYEQKMREMATALGATFTHLASLYAYLVQVTHDAWPGGYGQGNLSVLNLELLEYLMAIPASVRTLRTQLDNWHALRVAGERLSQQVKRSGADILLALHKGAR